MKEIKTSLIKKLREYTNVGIIECKKALVEANGDIERALYNIKKYGKRKAIKKFSKVTKNGVIIAKISEDEKIGCIFEVNCETDFVANNQYFLNFCKEISKKILSENISDISTLKNKFKDSQTSLITKVCENICIRRMQVLKGEMITSYVHHNQKIGVIVSSTKTRNKELLKNIAMHIAAKNPKYIHKDDIPLDIISYEYKMQFDSIKELNKSNKITDKIINGKIEKFKHEISLLHQPFILDLSKSVETILNKNDVKIFDFSCFNLGGNM